MIKTLGHDPLCKLAQPCDDETPAHGYCGLTAPSFCIHCYTWCICEELDLMWARTIEMCIAAVEAVDLCSQNRCNEDAPNALRALLKGNPE